MWLGGGHMGYPKFLFIQKKLVADRPTQKLNFFLNLPCTRVLQSCRELTKCRSHLLVVVAGGRERCPPSPTCPPPTYRSVSNHRVCHNSYLFKGRVPRPCHMCEHSFLLHKPRVYSYVPSVPWVDSTILIRFI